MYPNGCSYFPDGFGLCTLSLSLGHISAVITNAKQRRPADAASFVGSNSIGDCLLNYRLLPSLCTLSFLSLPVLSFEGQASPSHEIGDREGVEEEEEEEERGGRTCALQQWPQESYQSCSAMTADGRSVNFAHALLLNTRT